MDLDKIIKELNKKKITLSTGSENLKDTPLSEVEKAYIKTYSPEKSFIVYGTLAPGRPNHSVIEHIKGKWKKGIVRGKLENKGWGAELGYYAFKHTPVEDRKR